MKNTTLLSEEFAIVLDCAIQTKIEMILSLGYICTINFSFCLSIHEDKIKSPEN